MDPRERADVVLARARARGAFVITPDDAVSPMDAANTLQIPRSVVAAADQSDSTMVIPAATVNGQMAPPPAQQYPEQQPAQARPEEQAEAQPPPRQLDGLVPTTQHPGTQRSMLSRRLDGH